MNEPPSHSAGDREGNGQSETAGSLAAAIALALLGAAAFLILLVNDQALQRLYWSVNWPAWVWRLEDVASAEVHDVAIALGLAVTLLAGARYAVAGGAGILISFIGAQVLKYGLGRVRPCDAGDGLLFVGPNLTHVSFPSGHTTVMWTLAFTLGRRFPKSTLVLFAIAGLITWGRIHADAHFPGDIVGGIALAFIGSEVGWRIAHRNAAEPALALSPGNSLRPARILVLIALASLAPPLILTALSPGLSRPRSDDAGVIVDRLYETMLGREPDLQGKATYVSRLASLASVSGLAREMLESTEAVQSLSAMEVEQCAGAIYRRLLGRDPSPDELAAAIRRLAARKDDAVADDDDGDGNSASHAIRGLIRYVAAADEFRDRFDDDPLVRKWRTSLEK